MLHTLWYEIIRRPTVFEKGSSEVFLLFGGARSNDLTCFQVSRADPVNDWKILWTNSRPYKLIPNSCDISESHCLSHRNELVLKEYGAIGRASHYTEFHSLATLFTEIPSTASSHFEDPIIRPSEFQSYTISNDACGSCQLWRGSGTGVKSFPLSTT
jgi:hypothetical protein